MNAIGGAATFATNMGLSSAFDNQSRVGQDFSSRAETTLPGPGREERALAQDTRRLGFSQNQTLERLMSGDFSLSPEMEAQLSKMFSGAEANIRRFGGLMGQDLAGTRGLNTSDTPVTEAVLRETLPMIRDLEDRRIQSGLGLGMQMRNLNLNAALGMPGATGFSLERLLRNRMAQGTTTSRGFGSQIFAPGFLDRMATTGGAQKDITGAGATLGGGSEGMSQGMAIGKFFSDARLKQDIHPVSWKWKRHPDREYLGVLAQDVEKSHPHLVHRDTNGHLMVDYGAMVAMLLDERKTLYAELERQHGHS